MARPRPGTVVMILSLLDHVASVLRATMKINELKYLSAATRKAVPVYVSRAQDLTLQGATYVWCLLLLLLRLRTAAAEGPFMSASAVSATLPRLAAVAPRNEGLCTGAVNAR